MLMGNVIGASVEEFDDDIFEGGVSEIACLSLYFY